MYLIPQKMEQFHFCSVSEWTDSLEKQTDLVSSELQFKCSEKFTKRHSTKLGVAFLFTTYMPLKVI